MHTFINKNVINKQIMWERLVYTLMTKNYYVIEYTLIFSVNI